MEPLTPQTIDVTGLPDSAIRTIQILVDRLREEQTEAKMPAAFSSREEWAEAVRAWADSHPKRDKLADDSRESIYDRSCE
jgi:hypothetical protein